MQLVCKPASVKICLLQEKFKSPSIIYLDHASLHDSYDLPPGIGRAALTAGIHGLSAHNVYGSGCHHPDR
jgi:hypothetical protein